MIIKNYLLFFVVCTISCQALEPKSSRPTIGRQGILCDQNLKYIMEQEEAIFEQNYKYAQVDLVYKNEAELFRQLGEDSLEVAVSCRPLTQAEIRFFNNKQIHPRMFPFAVSGIALLVASNSQDSSIRFETLGELCKGSASKKSGFKGLVIEDIGSGIAQYLLDKFQLDSFGKQVYTIKNREELLNYVSQDPGLIAVMDWSEFSDSDDRQQQQRINQLKRLAITRPKDSTQMGFLLPDQYLLQDEKYPLSRTLYFISVSGKTDLGIGFASFVTSEIGQKILLKAGLLPKFQTDRWIELKSSPFRVVE